MELLDYSQQFYYNTQFRVKLKSYTFRKKGKPITIK